MKKPEIRKSYLLNKYVIITPNRSSRPRDVREKTVVERNMADCPFCDHNIDKRYIRDRIDKPNSKQWSVLSLKNKYPAVTPKNKKARGFQEVIVETPYHGKDLADLNKKQVERLLDMYKRRTQELAGHKKIEYILCFKNEGSKAGASIAHAHSQVFATEIIPPDLLEESKLIQQYKIKNGSCPYCDIPKKEIKSKRGIYQDRHMICFAPYASEYHYEAWIFPTRHIDNITLLTKTELSSLTYCLKLILNKMQKLNLSFNLFLHNVVSDQDQHFYIKIQPRDSIWAGVELGSGLVINSIPPEEAAEFYRDY
jgi:UDPglucose--hexose-1-phosphate uridylyltransferase